MTDGAGELDAGRFSEWLASMQEALRGEHDADVPCAGCTACCRSSQFVHIERNETATLARIPKRLLFPAPQRPDELVMGYDEQGHCPMLVDDRCSIYEHRPRACRTYDCRVLTASGVALDDEGKRAIAERVARWRFTYPTEADVQAQEEVRARASALADQVPSVTARAVLAVRPAPTA